MNYLIESAIQELRSPNKEARLQAAEYLRDHPHPTAILPLIDTLSDNSVDVAYSAAEAIAHAGPSAEEHLLAAFADIHDDSTRYLLLATLATIATTASEDLLIDALHSGNPDLAEVAAEALRHINTPNARRALQQWGD